MTRTRYQIYEKEAPHFLTCTVVNWLPLFNSPSIVISSSRSHAERGNEGNPVKRGYVDEPTHWRYSSARNYGGLPGLLEVETVW